MISNIDYRKVRAVQRQDIRDKAVSDAAPGDEYRSARERMVKSRLIPRGVEAVGDR
jgi:hypothetical protein